MICLYNQRGEPKWTAFDE